MYILRDTPFLPTPSARRATDDWLRYIWFDEISTHALREEGDDVPGQRYFLAG